MRVSGSNNPLDNTAVHPERYALVEQMAKDTGCSVSELIQQEEKRKGIDIQRYISAEAGLPTLQDILKELDKPSRDPRGKAQMFRFSEEVHEIEDLREGMQLPGIVTNITAFGDERQEAPSRPTAASDCHRSGSPQASYQSHALDVLISF